MDPRSRRQTSHIHDKRNMKAKSRSASPNTMRRILHALQTPGKTIQESLDSTTANSTVPPENVSSNKASPNGASSSTPSPVFTSPHTWSANTSPIAASPARRRGPRAILNHDTLSPLHSPIRSPLTHTNEEISSPTQHKRPLPDPSGFYKNSNDTHEQTPEPEHFSPKSFTSLPPPNRRRKIAIDDEEPIVKGLPKPDMEIPKTPIMSGSGTPIVRTKSYEKPTFVVPPSPTPDKSRQRRSTVTCATVRFKSNSNPFTPEGRLLFKNPNQSISMEEERDSSVPKTMYASMFKELELLGKGTYGEVYKCRHRIDGVLYAVKKSIRKLKGVRDRQNVFREVYGLAAVSEHSNIVRYYNSWEEDQLLHIQMELCEGGSLSKHVENGKTMTEAELLELIRQLATGLKHIHSLGLVHLDIKPENIYLKNYMPEMPVIYKIGDLGLMNEAENTTIFMDGDCRYLSRELLEDDFSCLRKSDIFSLGATIYELSRGVALPKGGSEWKEIRDGIIQCSPHFSAEFWVLVKSMMNPSPYARPLAEEILDNPLVNKYKSINLDQYLLEAALQDANQQISRLQHELKMQQHHQSTTDSNTSSPETPHDNIRAVSLKLSQELNKMQL